MNHIKNYIALIVILFFGQLAWAQNRDIDLLRSINTERDTNFDRPLYAMGQATHPLSLLSPAVIYSAGYLQKEESLKRKGLVMGASLLLSASSTFVIKELVDRQRPYESSSFIDNYSISSSASMPSGHVSNAFVTATSLTLAFPKWYVAVPAYAWATTVGYSRMHLGMHYPSDVLIGAVIGAGSAVLCHYLNKKLISK